jgi:hypothetical protein
LDFLKTLQPTVEAQNKKIIEYKAQIDQLKREKEEVKKMQMDTLHEKFIMKMVSKMTKKHVDTAIVIREHEKKQPYELRHQE